MAIFLSASLQYQLPQGLLESLCYVETRHDVFAVHVRDGRTDSLGVCQIKLATARHMGFTGTATELMHPDVNALYAAAYLRHQINRYHGDIHRAVMAYNAGHAGRATETRYVRNVFKEWNRRYGGRDICQKR